MRQANQILSELRKDENFWQSCEFILTHAHNVNTKFLALLALEEAINVIFLEKPHITDYNHTVKMAPVAENSKRVSTQAYH